MLNIPNVNRFTDLYLFLWPVLNSCPAPCVMYTPNLFSLNYLCAHIRMYVMYVCVCLCTCTMYMPTFVHKFCDSPRYIENESFNLYIFPIILLCCMTGVFECLCFSNNIILS